MKKNSKTKYNEKKKDSDAGNPRRSSRVSVVEPRSRSRSRVSSASIHGLGHSLAWRSDGKGGFKTPKYQNSYRLEPYLPFKCQFSDKILVQIMTEKLEDLRYNTDTCLDLCRNMTADIRDKLYKTDFDRVKYVVSVTIIENTGQSFDVANGRLWDSDRDTYSLFVFENPSLYAIGMIAVLYYE